MKLRKHTFDLNPKINEITYLQYSSKRYSDLNLSVAHNVLLGYIRGFHKHTTLAIMPILASDALPCKNTKNGTKYYPQ